MITSRDLQLEYTQDTGNTVELNQTDFDADNSTDYVRWIEEQLLFVRNIFGIDAVLMEKLKKIDKNGLR